MNEAYIVFKEIECRMCDGEGKEDVGFPGDEPTCRRCDGEGVIYVDYPLEDAIIDILRRSGSCLKVS